MKKLNKKQQQALNVLINFFPWAKKKYGYNTPLFIGDNDIILFSNNISGMRCSKIRNIVSVETYWSYKYQWQEINHSDILKIYNKALRVDATFASYVDQLEGTPESRQAFEKATLREQQSNGDIDE